MYKIHSILILGLLLTGCDLNRTVPNSLAEHNLRGRVKSLSVDHFDAVEHNGIVVKGSRYLDDSISLSTFVYYNEAGFIEFQSDYYTDNANPFKRKYKYNEENNVIEL